MQQNDKVETIAPPKNEERKGEDWRKILCKLCNTMVPMGRKRSAFIAHLAKVHNFTID
jgi:hypothetical protein